MTKCEFLCLKGIYLNPAAIISAKPEKDGLWLQIEGQPARYLTGHDADIVTTYLIGHTCDPYES